MIKEMVTIQENPQGGAIWVSIGGMAMVNIAQRCTEVKEGKIELTVREAKMFMPYEDAPYIHAGDRLSGNIWRREQQYPVDDNNPELYLSILPDGTYEKANGQYIWSYTVYNEATEDDVIEYGDQLVIRDNTTANH